ncbi:hypothetical protein U9M48_010833 [Paspalum notatum var. saurae]|uniref:Uncharacterized protein n=1 Tax=Paspalum notatum var. saurae TaxID=547442 RepID=A0AAQ3SU67_PASNO
MRSRCCGTLLLDDTVSQDSKSLNAGIFLLAHIVCMQLFLLLLVEGCFNANCGRAVKGYDASSQPDINKRRDAGAATSREQGDGCSLGSRHTVPWLSSLGTVQESGCACDCKVQSILKQPEKRRTENLLQLVIYASWLVLCALV